MPVPMSVPPEATRAAAPSSLLATPIPPMTDVTIPIIMNRMLKIR